jgi:hypothetical protein
MNADQLRRAVRRFVAVVAEMDQAQRRLAALRISPERYLLNSEEPPGTYGEFLFRTSGPLLHEPPAGERGQRGCPR